MSRRLPASAAASAAALALALPACGGDDAQATAQKQVCDARADISRQVDELQALDASSVTAEGVRGNLQAIRDSLETIRKAQEDLGEDRRKEVEAANEAFAQQIRQVGSTVLRTVSVDEARTQVRGAVEQLGGVYKATLGTVDCS